MKQYKLNTKNSTLIKGNAIIIGGWTHPPSLTIPQSVCRSHIFQVDGTQLKESLIVVYVHCFFSEEQSTEKDEEKSLA